MTWFLALGLMACGSDKDSDDSAVSAVPDDALQLVDVNNYAYTGDIAITSLDVQAGADSTIDWCALTVDLRGRPVTDPSAVDQLLMVEFDLTQAEVEAKIETNTIKQNDTVTQWQLEGPGACTAKMTDFGIVGNQFVPEDYMIESDHTWLVSVLNTPNGRLDFLMSQFIVPLDSSTNTLVTIDDGSATLTVDADLHSLTPLQAKAGTTPFVEWKDATKDVNGNPYDTLLGNNLLVGKVPVATVEEAEELFLRLDTEAEKLYYLDVYGRTSGDLSQAKADDGEVFPGFTTDGIWLVGVECFTCTSPAPLLLTVVEVTE